MQRYLTKDFDDDLHRQGFELTSEYSIIPQQHRRFESQKTLPRTQCRIAGRNLLRWYESERCWWNVDFSCTRGNDQGWSYHPHQYLVFVILRASSYQRGDDSGYHSKKKSLSARSLLYGGWWPLVNDGHHHRILSGEKTRNIHARRTP